MTRTDRDRLAPLPVRDRAARVVRWQEVRQGTYAVVDRPGVALTATLGSCVAVCLHDPVRRQGGMNHIFQCVQPGPLGGAAIVAEVERLVNALMRRGARRSGLHARVVGGAHTLERGRDLGAQIAGVCLLYLAAEDIPVLESTTGGKRARRAVYDPIAGTLVTSHPGTAIPVQDAPPFRGGEDWELF